MEKFDATCGIKGAVSRVFWKEPPAETEETHRCILNFQTMRQVYTHNELEVVMTRLGWKPLVKRGAWRRFYKRADYTRAYGVASMATIARLPSRSFVDAPKHIILDFVKTVNRRENRNVLCCWEHRGQLPILGWEQVLLH
ncbi:unnamed protein product [Sphagnum troendelagicum]|uniref:LAGLIDADG endonuclease n=1 Tax=Sphagnum troendelagicum TaxID=128251 RepID=A0ABP0U3V9_9BRYO